MRRAVLPFAVLGALLAADVTAQDLPAAAPVLVDLSEHVPRRWMTDELDELPLTPARWRRRMPPHCQTRGGYRDHCQGARIVVTPRGPAAALARRLALGQRATAMLLMHEPPLAPWLDAVAHDETNAQLTFPVPGGRMGRGFGMVREGELSHRPHLGVDIGADEGTPILAARGGLVVYADNGLTGYGNVIMLLHHGGDTTMYAHCRALRVFAGQHVQREQIIAEVGQTGFAPAPHLHFEWRQRGVPTDPEPQFQR